MNNDTSAPGQAQEQKQAETFQDCNSCRYAVHEEDEPRGYCNWADHHPECSPIAHRRCLSVHFRVAAPFRDCPCWAAKQVKP